LANLRQEVREAKEARDRLAFRLSWGGLRVKHHDNTERPRDAGRDLTNSQNQV
jgi:hypothetical protein